MTDTTTATAAQDTTAATQAEAGQSDSSVLTPPVEGQQVTDPAVEGQEAAAEGEKAEQDDQGDKAEPEDYADFTLADGVEMDADVLTEFKGLAKELGISQEAAQKLIDLQSTMETKRADVMQQALADQAQEWAKSIKNDKDFGGEHFDSNVALAVKTIETFGSPELRTMLTDSGLGNHPELVKFCHRIGKAISDDNLVLGGSQGGRKSDAEVFYGNN